MSVWLWQLSEEEWDTGLFRAEIWEGQPWHWRYNRKNGGGDPKRGDIAVFFYAPTKCEAPGFYGWAVIDRSENNETYFTPSAPTNHLKMDPWWDEEGEAKSVADLIRGVPRATLFAVDPESFKRVRQGIKRWLSSGGGVGAEGRKRREDR